MSIAHDRNDAVCVMTVCEEWWHGKKGVSEGAQERFRRGVIIILYKHGNILYNAVGARKKRARERKIGLLGLHVFHTIPSERAPDLDKHRI